MEEYCVENWGTYCGGSLDVEIFGYYVVKISQWEGKVVSTLILIREQLTKWEI